MHAVIRTSKVRKVEEVIDAVDNHLLAVLSALPGFVSYYLMQTGNDEVVSVSIYESEEQATDANKTALSWIKENMSQYIVTPSVVAEGKVAVHGGI